ncbi:MAG: S-methyl-5-thioribose-1-phosphate isomerase [Candidatus Latescibacterota bacterium]
MEIPTIRLIKGAAEIIDQVLLPGQYVVRRLQTVDAVCEAIKSLRIRGAPALGVAGAYGLLVAVEERWRDDRTYYFDENDDQSAGLANFPGRVTAADVKAFLDSAAETIGSTRPTAVNLRWALDRLAGVYRGEWGSAAVLLRAVRDEAVTIKKEDLEMCRALGRHGAGLLPDGASVITHCNTGGLATSGYGTALGVVFAAVESGKSVHVYADETRPLLQGARLTAWECVRNEIPVTVLSDGASSSLISRGGVTCAIVGADRIAANGDAANKIGTCNLAIVCKRFDVPFYVAAPSSTIDPALADGSMIPIEERAAEEVLSFAGVRTAPPEAGAFNPAFDVTPAELIAGIITENGVFLPPFDFAGGGHRL